MDHECLTSADRLRSSRSRIDGGGQTSGVRDRSRTSGRARHDPDDTVFADPSEPTAQSSWRLFSSRARPGSSVTRSTSASSSDAARCGVHTVVLDACAANLTPTTGRPSVRVRQPERQRLSEPTTHIEKNWLPPP